MNEIRERTDIVQIIEQYVQLKRSGINHKGLCPFHHEKTPSFTVHREKQFFHCFGCHETGDVITFLMKIEGRTFMEVVEELAARAGVELPHEKRSPDQIKKANQQKSERQQGLTINAQVTKLFERLLNEQQGEGARDYLEQRNITEEMIKSFQIGFAPPAGTAIVRFLTKEKISLDFAQQMGLVIKRSSNEGYYDRFWNRVMFPVINAKGEILGFSGRILPEGDGPKYLNSPETPLFHKGETLFGLHAASSSLRSTGTAIIVEGNIDVVQMHQHGFSNTVAPMGTALTSKQINHIKRFAERVIAVFDGDDAGIAAAQKAVHLFIQEGIEASIASLPSGMDPDTFLRKNGQKAMGDLLHSASPALEFLVRQLQNQYGDSIPAKSKILEQIGPLLATLASPITQELYIGHMAMILGLDPPTIRRALKGKRPLETAKPAPIKEKSTINIKIPSYELDLLAILVDHPHLFMRAEAESVSSLLTNDELRVTYQNAMNLQQLSGHIDSAQLLNNIPVSVKETIAQMIFSGKYASDGDPTRAFNDCLSALRRNKLKQELQDIRKQIAKARADGDNETERLMAQRLMATLRLMTQRSN